MYDRVRKYLLGLVAKFLFVTFAPSLLAWPLIHVVKLSATDGSVVWREEIAKGHVTALALDAQDAVVVAGPLLTSPNPVHFSVFKLDTSDGSIAWSYFESNGNGPNFRRDLAIDSNGDVVAVGTLKGASDLSWFAVKIDGVGGSECRRHELHVPSEQRSAQSVTLSPNGDAGRRENLGLGDREQNGSVRPRSQRFVRRTPNSDSRRSKDVRSHPWTY